MTSCPKSARWTSSVKLPNTNKDAKIEARAIEWRGNILVAEEISYGTSGPRDIKLSIFDTVTHELVDIPSEIPQINDEQMHGIAIYNDQLYMWFGRNQDGKLYKYDFNNKEWIHLMLIDDHPVADNIVMVGSYMCVSSANVRRHRQRIVKINLETDERVDEVDDQSFQLGSSLGLFGHHEQLYLAFFIRHKRYFGELADGIWSLKKVDDLRPIDAMHLMGGHIASWDYTVKYPGCPSGFKTVKSLPNGRMLLKTCVSSQGTYLDTFHFEASQWEKTRIENGWYDTTEDIIYSAIEINGVIYLLIKGSPFSDQYEIRMFDMRPQPVLPKLSTICMRDLVDTIVGTWDIENIQRIRKKLCIPDRKKFDNLTSWRIADFFALQPNGKDLYDEYERMRNGEGVRQKTSGKAHQ